MMRYKTREEIPLEYKWDLEAIFENIEKWEYDFKFVDDSIPKFADYKLTFKNSGEDLHKTLKLDEYLSNKLGKLYLYAFLSKDLDLNNSTFQNLEGRMKLLVSKYQNATAFITPNILEIGEKTLYKYMADIEELRIYKHFFENILRMKEHTLSADKEELLALSGPALQTSYNTFSLLKATEIDYGKTTNEKGEDEEISEAIFYGAMYSNDRDYRERVYRQFYKPYMSLKNTFASLFTGKMNADVFNAKAKNYSSSLEAALKPNNIPLEVYHNLVNSANAGLSSLHRWVALKKKILKYDDIHPYDMYVSLFPESKKDYSFEDARAIVTNTLTLMGSHYIEAIKECFDNRRIDVYETKGKRSGAYSSGVTVGVDPYVLMNWNGTLNDVSTLIHELGHNMHSYFTGQVQPTVYASYPIFTAEVASITNENLLHEYLYYNSTSKLEKMNLIETYINKIVSTFFRQTQFAEFELLTHEITEKGNALNAEMLTSHYTDIFKKYYGPEMTDDKEEFHTWARVPHFYYNFYVYQYATGLAASEVLSKNIMEKGLPAAGKMMSFLSSGNSKYPIDTLKDAGVDMTSKATIDAVITKMNTLMDELENLI